MKLFIKNGIVGVEGKNVIEHDAIKRAITSLAKLLNNIDCSKIEIIPNKVTGKVIFQVKYNSVIFSNAWIRNAWIKVKKDCK